MKLWFYLKRNIVRDAMTGFVIGIVASLVVLIPILLVVELAHLSLNDLISIVMAYGVLGLVSGLGLSLLRGLWRARSTASSLKTRYSYARENLLHGLGAGLVAGTVISLVEVVALMVTDLSLEPLTGLAYAMIVYGVLNLPGGLVLGLLWGLGDIWRDPRHPPSVRSVWPTLAALLTAFGTFLAIHNRVRRDILGIPPRTLGLEESLLVDNVLLALTVILAVGLWFLLRWIARHTRLARLRWNVGLYLALLLVAVVIGMSPGLAAALKNPGTNGIPPDLRDQPNIIFIVADTLRADRLGCYTECPGVAQGSAGTQGQGQIATRVNGCDDHLTPHIDTLAQDSVLYRNASVQASWTKPSVATMLTSLYPTSHGAAPWDTVLPDAVLTLPEILSARGYHTVGLTTNGFTSPRFNFQQGYDEYTYLIPTIPFFASPVSFRFAAFAVFQRARNMMYRSPTELPHDESYQDAALLTREALRWLEANKDSRFFLFLHYVDPHEPYFAHPYDGVSMSLKPSHPSLDQLPLLWKLYNGEVTYLDQHLGTLFDTLKQWELYDNTLIVFTSDHGEEIYEHKGFGHGATLYEEVLAVPLIIKYPHNAHAGTVDDGFARGLDIAPTILGVIGDPVPGAMQGVSLQPGAAVARAEFTFAELDHVGRVRAIRTGRYKYIMAGEDNTTGLPAEAFFDLQADPGEQENLIQDESDMARLLRAELDRIEAFAQSQAVAGQPGELDAATRERLRQLGY